MMDRVRSSIKGSNKLEVERHLFATVDQSFYLNIPQHSSTVTHTVKQGPLQMANPPPSGSTTMVWMRSAGTDRLESLLWPSSGGNGSHES